MNKPLVIITGASSGMGAAMAKIFSAAGYRLALFARHVDAMEKLNLPDAMCIAVDVTDIAAMKKAVHQAEEKFGPVDCLINDAGFARGGDFTDIDHDDHMQMVKVNLLGVINGVEAVLPGMRGRKTGTIINISSVADRNARPQVATYAATKAAVRSLSTSLCSANAKYGIRVCNVAPAKTKTPMLKAANLSEDDSLEAEDLAKAVLWIYEQPQTVCIRDIVVAHTAYES